MSLRRLAGSVDELIAGASARSEMTSADSKSGARFERVTIDGEPYVLKHVDRADDWIMRQTGDLGCWPVVVWESGVLDLVPPCIDHTIVGAARHDGSGGGCAVLMRDVGRFMVPSDASPLPHDQHTRFLGHLAAFHAATWGWSDDIGVLPLGNRYLYFGPRALECEAELGSPADVPRVASEGWRRLESVAPDTHAALAPLLTSPWPLVEALDDSPHAFLHGDWKLGNLGSDPDGRTVLVDWSLPGSGPPLAEVAHYLALNSARLPEGHTKDDTIDAYRGALEGEGVATEPWWDRQLALSLLAIMMLLGWEKAFDETGVELAWWSARVREGLDYL